MSATGRGAVRNPRDFYATPEHAYECLAPTLKPLSGSSVWEPAEGDGRITGWLRDIGWNSIGTDIAGGFDFLDDDLRVGFALHRKPHWIITNPPYSLALEFCEAAIRGTPSVQHVMFLLRLNFLGSKRRKPFLTANPPSAIIALSKRPSFRQVGKKTTDMCEYGWFYWAKEAQPWITGIRVI